MNTKRCLISLFVILLAYAWATPKLTAQKSRLVPKMLNYQGYLTDTLDVPINDTLNMIFRIYDASSGGNELWNETQAGVIIERGVFSVILGSVSAIPDSVFTGGTERWLEITVAGNVLSPRTRITSVGYAYTATYADTAEYARNATADNDWQVSGNNMWSIPSGNVGVGTSTPQCKFSINGDLSVGGHDISLSVQPIDHWQDYNIGVQNPGILGIHCDGSSTLSLRTDGNLYVDGQAGIGTTTPAERLDVNGTVAMTGFKMPTGASEGYVLTCDDTGVGTWESFTTNDSDWVRAGAPLDSVLFTAHYLGIARGGVQNMFYGDSAHTHINFGVACTTGRNGQGFSYMTISGGYGNKATSHCATVAGGYHNLATGDNATIGGGYSNTASEAHTVVSGGYYNTASELSATVSGGYMNTAGEYATVGGGRNNTASYMSTVGGGGRNTASSWHATVSGGYRNMASGPESTVGGGMEDTTNAYYGGVFSGYKNLAGDEEGDSAATVVGGKENRAIAMFSIVGGGLSNLVDGDYSAILGGYADTITASGDYSYLFGINSKLTADSTFMVDMPHIRFGDEANGYEFPTADGSANQVMVTDGSGQLSWNNLDDNDWIILGNDMYAGVSGNVGIGTTSPGNILTVQQSSSTDPIADAWTTYSSKRWMTNIKTIPDALQKVMQLRGVYFDWKNTKEHDIGMIAEEVGKVIPEVVYKENETDARSIDYGRLVALLIESVKEQQREIERLKAEVNQLKNSER
ncbi:MAG TPA: hypothetical protein ENI34_08485 [candidate division WOR-3 bacterium]|uniref:Peptidase S74 domain-containing protein n=1 Tax=candidate division WOR-3 bacterium TaxID=2052148 RepID=A0A9C9ENE1_UNCW3|nr:hypothetical protein [candidate division WOR-3 bacterium]